jgi:hypothetical protein
LLVELADAFAIDAGQLCLHTRGGELRQVEGCALCSS